MKISNRLLRVVLNLALVLLLVSGLALTSSAVAYNEVAGSYNAGDLTSYIFGDFVTEGDLPEPFGNTNPWSIFDWLTDGETITIAYAGPKISTAGTGIEGYGEYFYLGSAQMPQSASMGDLAALLLTPTNKDVRIYFFNETNENINVSFNIQSISKTASSGHSVVSVITPEGITALDELNPGSANQNLSASFEFTLTPYYLNEDREKIEYSPGDDGSGDSKRPADTDEGFAQEGCFYISLTTQPNLGNDPSAGVVISNFFAGADTSTLRTITLKAPEVGSYTATADIPDGNGTITVTETVMAGGGDKPFSYLPGNGFTLNAIGDAEYLFDYWSRGESIVSYDATINTRAYRNEDIVVANFLPKDQTRAFDVNGTRYISWTEAVRNAQSNGAVVTLVKDYTFATTVEELAKKGDSLEPGILENNNGLLNYILPAGVKFLVPFSAQDAGSFADGPGFSAAAPGRAYKTLTVPSGVTFSVNGNLNVNACAYANNSTSYMGGAAGDYGFISLDGTLNVESGGELRTYGYIAGPGSVHIKSGGNSYEVLQMTDWGGGSNAMSWKNHVDTNTLRESAFFFSQYYVQNIESDYRVHKDATAYVYGHLAVSMSGMMVNSNVPCSFIGEGDALFTITEGYIERRYDGLTDRITYDIHGDVLAKAITVDVMSIATVASAEWLLGLTSNMDIIASEGTTTLQYGYMVLPDTWIEVKQGASIVIDPTARVHIWRLDDWQDGFAGRGGLGKLNPVRYTVANGTEQVRTELTHSGTLINNGTVTMYSNVFTTDNGGSADDVVVQGNGTLINLTNPNGTPSGVLNQLKNSNEWVTIKTKPALSYMYGEKELSSFGTGTYYSKAPSVDTHGNGSYDSWYQWQVDYTLTDESGQTFYYTDYAYNSDIDLDGTLIVDGERYVITGVGGITDSSDNDISSVITWDGDVTVGGLLVNKNANIADGWEFIQFHGLNQNIKVALNVKRYDHRVVWNEALANGAIKTSAQYVSGNTAAYTWDQQCAVEAAVTPADGATANAVYGMTTVLELTDITKDVEVAISAAADSWPISVNVTYPDSSTGIATIFSTKDSNEVWTAIYAPEKPAEGWYVIDSVSLTNGLGVGFQNDKDSLTLTGVVTGDVVADVTLVHKDYKVSYITDGPALNATFVNSGETVNVANTTLGDGFVFGDATISTAETAAELTVTPTRLTLAGTDKDLTVNVSVIPYDYVVKADGQIAYVEEGGEATFILEAGYALNGASIPSNQVGSISYINPEDPDGNVTVTVSGVGSDVEVWLDKVRFDAIVTFKDTEENILATKYYGEGNIVTYTAVDEGAGSGNRFYVVEAASTSATVNKTTQTVSVTDVTEFETDVVVTLNPFTYKVTWNDGVQTTYTYLTGDENEATYTPPDEGIGGNRYIIQNGYGEHASGATNSYPASNGNAQFTVANINADEVVTLSLTTFTYKIVFTDQNDNVIKTQYSDANSQDVTISIGDKSIRYDVAGLDFVSDKKTIITSAAVTGTAMANEGADFGEGVQRVTLTEIGSDVTAKLEVYEYDHKILVVLRDKNGWSSETQTHYIEGETYVWTRPSDAAYNIDSVFARVGSAAISGDTVTMDLTGVEEVEAELDITTVRTEERLKKDLSNFAVNNTNGKATINVTDSAYGVFTVTCESACVVVINNGDGTYTKVYAFPTVNVDTYEFSLSRHFDPEIVLEVYLVGDLNKDGTISGKDTNRLKLGALRNTSTLYEELDSLQIILGDVNMDGVITAKDDIPVLQLGSLRSTSGNYEPLKWIP